MQPKQFLTRREASEYLTERGIPCAVATLAKYATVGGSPTISYFGSKPLYRPSDLDLWVSGRMKAVSSTSDAGKAA